MRAIKKQLKRLGVREFNRFEGIRPNFEDIPEEFYANMKLAPGSSSWHGYIVGSSGCKMSHIEILKQAKSKGLGKILVLEDDAIFKWRASSKIKKALRELPRDWDMIYFGGNSLKPSTEYSKHLSKVTIGYGTLAYGINMRIAEHTITTAAASGKEIDVFYAENIQPGERCFITNPKVAKVSPGWSDILEREVNYGNVLS